MKFFIYYYLAHEKFSERPINILILIDQAVDHLIKLSFFLYVILKVIITFY